MEKVPNKFEINLTSSWCMTNVGSGSEMGDTNMKKGVPVLQDL